MHTFPPPNLCFCTENIFERHWSLTKICLQSDVAMWHAVTFHSRIWYAVVLLTICLWKTGEVNLQILWHGVCFSVREMPLKLEPFLYFFSLLNIKWLSWGYILQYLIFPSFSLVSNLCLKNEWIIHFC